MEDKIQATDVRFDKIEVGSVRYDQLQIGPLVGGSMIADARHVITVPEPANLGIKLSAEARRRLLDAMPVHDMLYCLAGESCDDPNDPDWGRIEDALTEIMLPPQRYALGMPAHDRCPRCGVNSRRAGAASCEGCGS